MQATVREFDPLTQAGSVLLDDGTALPFSAQAFTGSGLRLLRLGQRVRIEIVSDAREAAQPAAEHESAPSPSERRSEPANPRDGVGDARRVRRLTLVTLPLP